MHDEEFKGAEEEALKAWQGEPKQKVVAKELADFGKLIFGESFIGTKIRPVPETETNAPGLQKIAKKLKFGEIVFYDPAGNKIFLNKNSERPLLIVMGHESLHKLKENAPDLYKKLDKILKGKELEFDKYMKNLNSARKAGGIEILNTEEVREEFIADFVGEAMAKPTFWKKLNAEDPSLARKLAKIVIELVKRIRKAAASGHADPQGPWKYFKDIDVVEAEAAKIYAQYAKKAGEAQPVKHPTKVIIKQKIPEGWKVAIQPNWRKRSGWKAEVDWEHKRIVFETTKDAESAEILNHEIGHILIENELSKTDFPTPQKMSDVKSSLLKEYANITKENDVHPNLVREHLAMDYGTYLSNKSELSDELVDLFEKHMDAKPETPKPAKAEKEPLEKSKKESVTTKKPEKIIPPSIEQLVKLSLDEDIKYTKKVKVGGRITSASKNAGEALSEVTEQRDITKRILNCV